MINVNDYFSNINILYQKDVFKETTIDTMKNLPYFMSFVKGNDRHYDNVEIEGEVYIGENVKIDSFTKIIGPCVINDNVEISTNVLIRPNSILGKDVKVGHGSEIKNAILMDGAKVATNVFVGDSIIGYKTRIGSGTIIANRRFDQKNVKVHSYENNEDYETDLDYFGAVVGDESRLGANCVTMPGCHIGHDTFIVSGLSCGGIIPSNVIVDDEKYKNLTIRKKDKIYLD